MSDNQSRIAAEGVAPDGEPWTLRYAPTGEQGHDHHLALIVRGSERESGSGFDIPSTTQIGFGGGLVPGQGNYYLYGLTTSRILAVRAESHDVAHWTEAGTRAVPGAFTAGGDPLRAFVLVRPPVDDVIALVGLDDAGHEVQRVLLLEPPERP